MQDDKKSVPTPAAPSGGESRPESSERIAPSESQLSPDVEGAPRPETEAQPEVKEELEQEKAPEKEIEQIKEELRTGQVTASDDEEEKKLKVLKEADKLRDMEYEGRKIEHLMQLTEARGVEFAVAVAKKTNDACLLDLFHDKIIEKGLQKESG